MTWSSRGVRALLRRVTLGSARSPRDTSTEELRSVLRAALRAQSSLPRDAEALLVDSAVEVACAALEEERWCPEDVVRGLLRWHTLTGLPPDRLAHYAICNSDFLLTPAETIVGFVFMLRELLPRADLTRVFAALPMGGLLCDEEGQRGVRLAHLRYSALDALTELRQFMPEAIVQLLVEEAPTLLFGELSIANAARLRDAWLASGSAQLTEAELATAMRDPKFVRYFTNFVM